MTRQCHLGTQARRLAYQPSASTSADYWAPSWHSDGKRLVYLSDEAAETSLVIYEIASGKTKRIVPDSGHYYAPAWRP